jgi:hypothetical protein
LGGGLGGLGPFTPALHPNPITPNPLTPYSEHQWISDSLKTNCC